MTCERNLGFWETLKVLTHDMFNGNDIAVLELHLNGVLNLDYLKKSLSYCFDRHPLLRATIHEKNDSYAFSFNLNWDDIPFHIIQQTSQGQWHEIIEKEINKCFQKDKCLWRITLLEAKERDQFHLIFSFHHAICDGASIFTFLDEVLKNYEKIEQGDDIKISPLPLYDPQDELLPKKISWDEYFKNARKFQAIGVKGWKFHKNAPICDRKTHHLQKQLPLSLIKELKEKCKQHEVSLNALFNAVVLMAKQKTDNEPYDGTLCTWVNTRERCAPKVANEHFGYFVNFIATKHDNIGPETDVWCLAKEYYVQLKLRLPELSCFPGDFDLDKAISCHNMQHWTELDNFLYDITLSYLSKVPLQLSYGNLELIDINIAVNKNSGFAGILLEIFVFSDHITFACCYAEPLIEKSWIERFMDCFEQSLIDLIAE